MRRLLPLLVALALIALALWALMPRPLAVDLAVVEPRDLTGQVEDTGTARAIEGQGAVHVACPVGEARVDAARLDVERAVIRAPIDGVVTRRQVQVGQKLAVGVPIMTIVPLDKVYVEANFKERQLRRVRVGQAAEVTADIYGSDVTYRGKVVGIAGGTGSSMAIIPAQNATGNWIKVVQRVPVRIEIDPRDLKAHPLRVGLSAEVSIDLASGD